MTRKAKATAAYANLPTIPKELLDQLGNGPMTADAINAASLAFKKALIERALGGELNHHLGYSSGEAKPAEQSTRRNGKSEKTVLTDDGPIRIDIPRDRDSSFEPILIAKHERRDRRTAARGRVALCEIVRHAAPRRCASVSTVELELVSVTSAYLPLRRTLR